MNNLLVRALSGAVFVVLVIGSLYYDVYAGLACLAAFTVLGLYEFYQLFRNSATASVSPLLGTFLGLIVFVMLPLCYFRVIPPVFAVTLLPLFFLSLLAELWRKKENPILNLGIQFLGVFYVAVPFTVMAYMQILNSHAIIFMFLLIWSNDTFAYLTGRMLGRTKLFERISPNKTWEGTIGGIVMTVVVASLIAYFSKDAYSFWIPAAVIVASCAIFGDLLESLFKRSLNIKDSGNIMPGHGGILDRFDAALFTAPFFFCWWLFYSYF